MTRLKPLSFLVIITIFLFSCDKENLNFTEPTTVYHFTPDTCKTSKWEIRDFKITVPKSFKINEEITANYMELSSEVEVLNFGSASLELDMALAADNTDKKLKIKNSEGYVMYFDKVRGLVDEIVVEPVVNELINYYIRNTSATLYSKTPLQKIMINDMPTSYSGFTLYGKIDNKDVWNHNAVIFIPNPADMTKSLFAVFTIKTEKLEILSAKDFYDSESYKIISSIQFN